MKIKRYSFFSFLLILLIGLFVYSQTDAKYSFEILNIPITLPVAVWIVLPMILLYLASLFHFSYYSFKKYIIEKRYKKDYEKVIKSIFNAILHESKPNRYNTKEFKNIGAITDNSDIVLKNFSIEGCKEELLKKAIEYVKDINRGDYVEIKEIELSPKNPLNEKNLENRMKIEPTYSGVILKKCDEFGEDLCKKALKVFISYADIAKIKDYSKLFDKDILNELIKYAKDKERKLQLNISDIIYIIQESKLNLNEKDYIELAENIKEIYMPEERLKLFELLKNSDEKAEAGYIYTLLDLEMIDKAKDELENSAEDELLNFKAFLDLKEIGRNYPLKLFV